MKWMLLLVAVIAVLMILMVVRARSIARRHAETLSQWSGVPADTIFKAMIRENQTPGEWAEAHGLDPMTFEPEP
ncbi:MAG: hypothetical protein M5U23_02555 [Acidimicrobiia bacterium]|nr:hypothetical protein [Acidimicrobiia bacterium]